MVDSEVEVEVEAVGPSQNCLLAQRKKSALWEQPARASYIP